MATIIFGFLFFAVPNLFFGIFKINDGLIGTNLAIIGISQFVMVTSLIYFSLKYLKKDMTYIGLNFNHWKRDLSNGLGVTLVRVVVDFGFIIPNTGGANRADVLEVINSLDGTTTGLISLLILGVVGGGITEEIYNRGFFINIMKDLFKNETVGLWISSVLSILFFSVGHLPSSNLLWYDILVASIIYTSLFLYTGRLTAPMIAHAAWNSTAILLINYWYF
ncbi:CPBP family intramembrane glutamic endopeptidase [Algoriphagus yeomjeoni]|uniref:CPBP family intramembrane glutamic endopeptidase n=1 Tax=Algoriphagus yeomjeoni TaxID=291403 RepID=UPI001FE7A019|nr:CPBP family intramembrane glutamic endopeptidase [Algoriphagus yeomjeoni]